MASTSIHSVLAEELSGLDETILEYLASMIEESENWENLSETITPFLISTGFVEEEDEAEEYCRKIEAALSREKGLGPKQEEEELTKLDQTHVIEEMGRGDVDETMMNLMWGFDKIRSKVNDTFESQVAISQRQVRKQLRIDKIQDEKEREEAEKDREWEDARVLPDLSGKNTGEKDIHVDNVTLSFKGLTLLLNTPLKLVNGRRYGLVGKNGTGKTTLIRHISKYEIEKFPRHIRMQHVEQESASKLSIENKTVLEVVLASDYERDMLLKEVAELKRTDENDKNSGRLTEIYERLIAIDADSAESRARSILLGLQFTQEMIDGPAANLSGGWRMRTALAGALFMSPDLLLLDEPTNHLDLEAVLWLERYLQSYEKTLIVVSHDRNFLDEVITDVIYLHNKKLLYYKGDFGTFEKTRKEMLRQQRKAYDAQQMKIAHMQEFIERFRSNAKKAPLVQSRVKALDKLELIEEPEDEQAFRMQFPPPEPLGRPIISISDVAFSYSTGSRVESLHLDEHDNAEGDDELKEEVPKAKKPITSIPKKPIFTDVNIGVDMTSRIGILGVNGSGKSTLLNLILGKLRPSEGSVVVNPRLRIASFTQHHVDQLAMAKSAVENMMDMFPGHEPLEFRKHLGRFNVTGEMAIKPTRKLSGGQKSRVAFAILTWRLPHVIVMDEPTNHLDIETIDALITALNGYTGGVIIVSHDQHFVEKICQELWIVGEGKVSRFRGSMADYKKMVLK